MKIALVTRRYPPLIGGAERVLSYLAPALVAEGAEVDVLTSRVEGLPTVEDDSSGSCRVVRLATSKVRFVGTWLYMRELARWFARNRVDVAYVSMLKHDAYVVVEQGKRRGFPVVLRPEGAGATGDLAWQKWGRFGRQIGERCKRADAFVAISPSVRGELVAEGYDPSRIFDLPSFMMQILRHPSRDGLTKLDVLACESATRIALHMDSPEAMERFVGLSEGVWPTEAQRALVPELDAGIPGLIWPGTVDLAKRFQREIRQQVPRSSALVMAATRVLDPPQAAHRTPGD